LNVINYGSHIKIRVYYNQIYEKNIPEKTLIMIISDEIRYNNEKKKSQKYIVNYGSYILSREDYSYILCYLNIKDCITTKPMCVTVYENHEYLFEKNDRHILHFRNINMNMNEKTSSFFDLMLEIIRLCDDKVVNNLDIFNIVIKNNEESNLSFALVDYNTLGKLQVNNGSSFNNFLKNNCLNNFLADNINILNNKRILSKILENGNIYYYCPSDIIKKIFGKIAYYIIINIATCKNKYEYLLQKKSVYDHHILSKKMSNTQNIKINNLNDLENIQFVEYLNCIKQEDTFRCLNNKMINYMDKIYDMYITNNKLNDQYLRIDNVEIDYKYINSHGKKLNLQLNNDKINKLIRRIVILRFQYSQLKHGYELSSNLIKSNYDFFDKYLDNYLKKVLNLFETEIYTQNGLFNKELFCNNFITLTTDFPLSNFTKLTNIHYFRDLYYESIYNYVIGIIKNGNIRNKLFVLLTFSKMLHYMLIRKLFIVIYVNKNPKNLKRDEIFSKYGISNIITIDNSTTTIIFDIENYCLKKGLNYALISYRYNIVNTLLNQKKKDILQLAGYNENDELDMKFYLFDILDKNIKASFLLYMYENYKYGYTGRIFFDWKKIKEKDYNYTEDKFIFPKIDIYEPIIKNKNKIKFMDRGIDTQRLSVNDKDNSFYEAFTRGEPVLAGSSGHTADILLLVGYFENNNVNMVIKPVKIMVIICIAVMFPRKDHSIFEMYNSMELFNNAFNTNIFTCPVDNQSSGNCLKWLLKTTCDVSGKIYNSDIYEKMINCEKYLSVEYVNKIKKIILFLYENNQILLISKLVNKLDNIFIDDDLEKFIFLSILKREIKMIDLDDREYVYNIEQKHIAIKNFIDHNLNIPTFLEDDDIFLYEDELITCTRSLYDMIRTDDDINNIYTLLQKKYGHVYGNVCKNI
jgi:hypothetical protein